MLVAPSPKLTTVTRSSPRISAASARPFAMGTPAPTIPVVNIAPDAGSDTWGEPPLPLFEPVARPNSSAIIGFGSAPLASTWAWPR